MSMREAALPAGSWSDADGRAPLFRKGWEIAAMVVGFVVFWPVGLAILGYFLVRRHKMQTGEGFYLFSCRKDEARAAMKAFKADLRGRMSGSGNAAFDDYRTEVLRRLEEERRKLDEEQMAFREFMLRLKRAKDQEEFDRFMAERHGASRA